MTVIKNILTVIFICSMFSIVLIDYLRDFIDLVTKKKQAELGTIIALGVRLSILVFIVIFSIEFVRLILLRN